MGEPTATRLLSELRSLADEEQAHEMRRYFKTSRMEFLGVKSPDIRRLAKQYSNRVEDADFVPFLRGLWAQEFYEGRRAAIDALLHFIKRGLPTDTSITIISEWIDEVDTWALTDPLGWSVSQLIQRDPGVAEMVAEWSSSPNRWRRRMAIVPYVDICKKGRYRPEYGPLVLKALGPSMDDAEFFVAKAVGWVLRELSKRDPTLVRGYLEKHEGSISGLALREGSKKLPT